MTMRLNYRTFFGYGPFRVCLVRTTPVFTKLINQCLTDLCAYGPQTRVSLRPLIRLVWGSLINNLTDAYDLHPQKVKHRLLLDLDEAGRPGKGYSLALVRRPKREEGADKCRF